MGTCLRQRTLVTHLHCNWSAVPDATIHLAKGTLANKGTQLHILPGLLLPSPAHLRAPQQSSMHATDSAAGRSFFAMPLFMLCFFFTCAYSC